MSKGATASDTAASIYYDRYSFEIDENPYPWFKLLRDEAPLYYNEKYNFYALSRFADVDAASKDWETFSFARGTVLELPADKIPKMIIFMDPPQHSRMRALVNRGFKPRQIAKLESRLREIASELLAPFGPADTWTVTSSSWLASGASSRRTT